VVAILFVGGGPGVLLRRGSNAADVPAADAP